MRIDLTDLSYQAFEQLSNPATTSFHASEYLQSRLQIREFYPTLTKMYSGNDLMERLLHAFTEAKPALSSAAPSINSSMLIPATAIGNKPTAVRTE